MSDSAQFSTRMGRIVAHARNRDAFWSNLSDDFLAAAASTVYSVTGLTLGPDNAEQDLKFLSGLRPNQSQWWYRYTRIFKFANVFFEDSIDAIIKAFPDLYVACFLVSRALFG